MGRIVPGPSAGSPSGAAGGQLGGSYPNPDVRGLRETSGPTQLTLGSVADGEFLKRTGATVVGGTASVSVDPAGAILSGGSGLALSVDTTTTTITTNAVAVLGVPSLFTIGGTAVGAGVTATNLDDLTDGGATTLHSHALAAHTIADHDSFATGSDLDALVGGTGGGDSYHLHQSLVEYLYAEESLTAGDLVCLYAGSTGTVAKADANATGKTRPYGYAISTIAAGNGDYIQHSGLVRVVDAKWAGSVPVAADRGKPVYVSETAGLSTLTPPSSSGTSWAVVGVVANALGSANSVWVHVRPRPPIALR